MTEKRFILFDDVKKGTHSGIWDKQKQHNQGIGDELWVGEVVAMLNEGVMIAEENEQLKKELHKIKVVNEMLSMDFANSEHELWKENEQLKSVIKEVSELLSDEVDLFSDKATEHDIIAYVELKELDNKDAFYMATATKKAIRMLKELQE